MNQPPEVVQVACRCTGEEFKAVSHGTDLVLYCARCGLVACKFTLAPGQRIEQALGGGNAPEIIRIDYPDPAREPLRDEHGQVWPKPLPAPEQKAMTRRGVAVRFAGGPMDGQTLRFPADVTDFYIGPSHLSEPGPAGEVSSGWGGGVPAATAKAPHYVEESVEQDGTKIFTWTGGEAASEPG